MVVRVPALDPSQVCLNQSCLVMAFQKGVMMYHMRLFTRLCAIPYPRPQKGGRVASAKSTLCGQKQKQLLVGSGSVTEEH